MSHKLMPEWWRAFSLRIWYYRAPWLKYPKRAPVK